MFPLLLKIGPVTLHTYGFFVAMGVLLGMGLVQRLAKRDLPGRKDIEDPLYQLLIVLVVGGLLGARLLYVLTHWVEFEENFWGVFKMWEGGLVSFGGLAGALVGFIFWFRSHRDLPWLSQPDPSTGWRRAADWFAPTIAFGHSLGRLGCLSAGCCYGRPTLSGWGIVFTHPDSLAPTGIPLYPTQIYESVFLVFLGIYLLKRYGSTRKQTPVPYGTVFFEYLLIYSFGRFAIEFWRGDELRHWGLSPGQFESLTTFLIALAFRFRNRRGSLPSERRGR